ncbi:MAG: rhomboid family intramembrane serine protease [Bacteroidota bacterium]
MNEYRPGGFQQLPMVVKNLLIINILVFLLQNLLDARGLNIDDMFALHYWASPKFRWWQMFTHMFMHGGISHILMNMFALWMFGRILENVWGPRRFIMFYLICGLGAAVCHMGVLAFEFSQYHNAFLKYQSSPSFVEFMHFTKKFKVGINPQAITEWGQNQASTSYIDSSIKVLNDVYLRKINEATVGASGAIFGLLFAFGYLFPNTLLYVYFAIPVKAKWFVAAYAAIELFSGIQNSAGDNVAHFAHLGGMLFAFILLRIWNDRTRNRFN